MTSHAEYHAACILPREIRSGFDPHPVRICIVDLGTNSFHAVVGDAYPNGTFQVKDKLKNMVHMGERGLRDHRLTEEAMQRGVRALKRIYQLAEGRGVEEYLAFATSAIREATNGGDFIRRVYRQVGLEIHPIPAGLEAKLIYKGVREAVDLAVPALLVDIGGGSTEFTVGTDSEVFYTASLKIGAARMTERFVTTDPLAAREYEEMVRYFRRVLEPVVARAEEAGVVEIVGSSGTMKNLARASVDRYVNAGESVYDRAISPEALRATVQAVIRSSRDEREAMPGIEEKRLDQIVAGAVLVETLLEDLKIEQFRVSPDALREGMAIYFVEQNSERLERVARFDTVRRRSVYGLGYTCRWDEQHANQVAAIALILFDACRSLHEQGLYEREILEYAALLHDIGSHVSRRKHHKHSRYLIEEGDMRGFTSDETRLIANIARYHRGSLPKPTHDHFARLSREDRQLVRQLASLLRLAEGLDRSHCQNVTHLSVDLAPDAVTVGIRAQADPQLEIWSTRRNVDLFEQTYDMEVHVGTAEIADSRSDVDSAVKGKHLWT